MPDNKTNRALRELARMLYEDLRKAGRTPQQALTESMKAIIPLMR